MEKNQQNKYVRKVLYFLNPDLEFTCQKRQEEVLGRVRLSILAIANGFQSIEYIEVHKVGAANAGHNRKPSTV